MGVKQTEALKLALKKAFDLGKRYWSWADSEYSSHWKKADAAKEQFNQLVEDTIREALADHSTNRPTSRLDAYPQEQVAAAKEDVLSAVERHGLSEQPAQQQEPEYKGWYCAHCERGVDGSEVTYHEQHTVCGRVITDDLPPSWDSFFGNAEQPAKEKAPQSANCEAPGWINSDHARGDDCTTEQPAQQEPVAWPCVIAEADFEKDTITLEMQCSDYMVRAGQHWLSTSPQPSKPWVGLTNQELIDLTAIYSGAPLYCAIEAKLREKNARNENT